ncbi:hypothetical protein FB446DRAFT_794397 [Lentinula raphanica]|nr:hypothetical protein FB446DRAFT_794397 [Lentinula raphanica]
MYLFHPSFVPRGTKVFSRLLVLTGVVLALSAFVNGMPVPSSVNSTQISLERRAGIAWKAEVTWFQLNSDFVHPDEETRRQLAQVNEAAEDAIYQKARGDGDTVTEITGLDSTPPKGYLFKVKWVRQDGQGDPKFTNGNVEFYAHCPRCSVITGCAPDCGYRRFIAILGPEYHDDSEPTTRQQLPKLFTS